MDESGGCLFKRTRCSPSVPDERALDVDGAYQPPKDDGTVHDFAMPDKRREAMHQLRRTACVVYNALAPPQKEDQDDRGYARATTRS